MKLTLQTKSGLFEVEADPGETLLAAALRQGVTLPYECATGTCGTCRGRVMEGEAEMAWAEAPGAAKLKRERGDCLLCQTRITTDAVVRVPTDKARRVNGATVMPAHRRGRLEAPRHLTHDVMEFALALDAPMRFEAGQFVIVEAPGLTGARAYSMVNFAHETDRAVFVVKRKPGGGFSDWLFGGNVEGAGLRVFGPLGSATFHEGEGRNILCIAGGSGIAGIMSILDRATAAGHFARHRGDVFFGVRTLADGFYLDALAGFVERAGGNLSVTLALSHEDAGDGPHPDHPGIRLDTGFVHEAAARAMAGRYDAPLGYVAGPPPMVDAAIRLLITQGKLPVSDIRYDKFG
jgi:toluene monooxygenase electron transfer component